MSENLAAARPTAPNFVDSVNERLTVINERLLTIEVRLEGTVDRLVGPIPTAASSPKVEEVRSSCLDNTVTDLARTVDKITAQLDRIS